MAQKILGLDLREDSIRAVVLEAALRAYEVRAQLTVPIEAPPPAEEGDEEVDAAEAGKAQLREALRRVMEAIGVKPEVVVAALPSFRAASPLITLPFTETRKIEATLGFEVEGILPFDVDEVIYDYQVVSQEDGKSELLVGVALESEVRDLVELLAEVGLDPRVITLPGLGTYTLLAELASGAALPAGEAMALVDIGADRTLFAVAKGAASERLGPGLIFSRALQIGHGPGAEGEDGGAEAQAAALAPLLRELRQSLRAAQARTETPIRRLVLSGEGAQVEGIASFLGERLGLEVQLLRDLAEGEEAVVPAALETGYTQAFGLALRGQQRSGQLLNLRKGELAFKGDLDYLRGKLTRLGAFAAVFALLLGVQVWTQFRSLDRQEEALQTALCEVTTRALGTCETDFAVAISKLQGGDKKAALIPAASALEVFAVAADQLTEEDLGLQVEEIDASLDRLRLRGVVDSFESVEQVEAGLRKSRCVGEIKRGRVQKNRDDKVEFTLDAQYVCGQGAGKVG